MAKRTDSRKTAPQNKKRKQPVNGETLRDAVVWVVDAKIFTNLKFHGNTSWQVFDLIVLAVVWVWSDSPQLTGAFAQAQHWSMSVLGRAALESYQGLLRALVTWTASLLPLLWERLHELMEKHGGKQWRVGLWLALAVDGSRVSVPRTKENEAAFCAPNYGKSATAKHRRKKRQKAGSRRRLKTPEPVKPQIWITQLWHTGLQNALSLANRASYSSEREHMRSLIDEQEFPENTLFCGDAGFTGYELWNGIIDRGHSFLIRVGANVKLLRNLGYYHRERAGIVYCWPNEAARKKQRPLVLRLPSLQVGRCKMHLLTNVLNEKKLTVAQAIRLYQLRWGIETYFKVVKSGCKVEKLQLETTDRVMACVAVYLIVAWRVLYLVHLGRECPEMPCDAVLMPVDWQAVWRVVKEEDPPRKVPSLGVMIQLIAQIGGYIPRKNELPGAKTMWIGLQRTRDFALVWEIFHPSSS